MLKLKSMTAGGQRLPRFSEGSTLHVTIAFDFFSLQVPFHKKFSGVFCDIKESYDALVEHCPPFLNRNSVHWRSPSASITVPATHRITTHQCAKDNLESNPIGFFYLSDDLEDICVKVDWKRM